MTKHDKEYWSNFVMLASDADWRRRYPRTWEHVRVERLIELSEELGK